MALDLLLRGELEHESSGALEDIHWVPVEPVCELVLPSLDEDGDHVVPVIWSQQRWVVCDLEEEFFASKGALHFDLALVFVKGRRILHVLTSD